MPDQLGRGIGFSRSRISGSAFPDKTSAENAEMPVLVGTAAEGVWQALIHRPSIREWRARRGQSSDHLWILTPGARSTPRTLDAAGPGDANGFHDVAGVQPARDMKGSLRSRSQAHASRNVAPHPPGRVASLARGIEQDAIGTRHSRTAPPDQPVSTASLS